MTLKLRSSKGAELLAMPGELPLFLGKGGYELGEAYEAGKLGRDGLDLLQGCLGENIEDFSLLLWKPCTVMQLQLDPVTLLGMKEIQGSVFMWVTGADGFVYSPIAAGTKLLLQKNPRHLRISAKGTIMVAGNLDMLASHNLAPSIQPGQCAIFGYRAEPSRHETQREQEDVEMDMTRRPLCMKN